MKQLLLLFAGLSLLQAGARAECNPISGIASLLKPGVVLLLGEIHGTVEGPGAVDALVCAALKADLGVAVGLEIPVTEEHAAQTFFKSAGTAEDFAAVIAGDFWQRDYQDGRASQAMHDLLNSLRSYQRERLHLFFIDDPGAPEGRDQFMANRVVDKSAEIPNAIIIVLTGNLHNRITIGTRFDANYAAMGFHVRDMLPDAEIISLNITYSGGSAWVCSPECGVIELGGRDGSIGVELLSPDDDGYTGRLHVGEIRASLPAKER